MDVSSQSVLPVSSIVWQPRPGAWALTVVCKATYALAPAESRLAPEQEPIHALDDHWDDDPARSLRVAGDLAPVKLAAEVVLVGNAFAPGGVPARSVIARLLVAGVDKSVEVFCDRSFSQQGALTEGSRFTRMPLGYERAAGGPETWNPVGLRRDARDRYGRILVPNLQRPDAVVSAPNDYIETIGFGPIAPSWPLRQSKLGRGAAAWAAQGISAGPVPDDLDRAYFNVAPPDQQTAEIRDNERIVLDNLHPEHPHFVTSLPGVRPRAVVTGRVSGSAEIALRADTLWIDTSRQICTLTWRGQIILARADEPGRVVVALEHPKKPLTVDEIVRSARGIDGSTTMRIDEEATSGDGRTALPFAPADSVAAMEMPRAPAPPPPKRTSIGEMTLALDGSAPLPDLSLSAFAGPRRAPEFTTGPQAVPNPGPPPSSPFVPAPPPIVAAPPPPLVPIAPPMVSPPPLPALASVATPWAPVMAESPGMATARPIEPLSPPPIVPAPSIGMVMAASNAAAGANADIPEIEAEPAPESAPVPVSASHDVLALIWFDRKALPRIERKPAFRRILDELDEEPVDPEDDDPALSDDPRALGERVNVFAILDRAAAVDVEGALSSLARAAGKRGRVTPPLELFEGELVMALDEVETLSATVATVTPFAGGDEALAGPLATAKEFLASAGARNAPIPAAGLTAQIRSAYQTGKHRVSIETLNQQVERALIEQRHYQKRKVLGGPHLRGLLHSVGNDKSVVVYLPEALAADLPLAARFRARMIAEVHLGVDDQEELAASLKPVGLGRIARLDRPASD